MAHKKPGRFASILLLAGCAFPVLLMLILPFRGQLDASETENRSLTHFPALTLGKFSSGEFQKRLEEALSDQYPFGETLKGALVACQDRIYRAESNLLHILFPASVDTYSEIANGYYCYAGDEERIVEKAWPPEKYEAPTLAQAELLRTDAVPTYLYFIRNSRAQDFTRSDEENDEVFRFICNAYRPDGAACFSAADYEEYTGLFYASDHHWNNAGSDRGYREIIHLLLGEDEATIPIQEEKSYPVSFHGSYARQSGRMVGEDSFRVYTYDVPRFITLLNGKDGVYGHQALYEKGRYPTDELRNHYAYYYGGDYGEIIIRTKNTEKQNLLILADSYSNPLNTLIASHFNNTFILDLRYYERDMGETLNLDEYIRANEIDKILLLGDVTFFSGIQDGGAE